MQKLHWLFLNLGLSTVHKNLSRFFVAVVSAEIEVKFCENCIRSSFICLWWKVGAVIRDVTRGTRASVTLY